MQLVVEIVHVDLVVLIIFGEEGGAASSRLLSLGGKNRGNK